MTTAGPEPTAVDRSVRIEGTVAAPVVTGDRNKVWVGSYLSRHQWLLWLIALMVMCAIAGIAVLVKAARDAENRRIDPVRTGAYTVTIRGSAVGGSPFEQQGELRIRHATDSLPYEWCLRVGDPWGAPVPGAILFGTNGTCFGPGADVPVVTLTERAGEVVLVPVNPPPALRDSMNAFTATSGIASMAYVPDGGEIRFRPAASKIEGSISLQGIGAFGESGSSTFTATLAATLVSEDPEALLSRPIAPAPVTDTSAPGRRGEQVAGTRYTVKTITLFRRLQGSPDFDKTAQARFAKAVFIVDARDGGLFVYDPPDSRTDIFPVTGTVTTAAPVYVLSGRRSSGEGATAADAVVGGVLDLSGNEPVIRLTLTTTALTTTTSYEVEAVLRAQ
ncbi:hypothetical protein AB0L22_10550 [Micromonospora haikouensis]|uniref:hypothetical protein n=1 Tax=Micromonospora haikouensis TaxID=686309 RepID=UPI00342048DC